MRALTTMTAIAALAGAAPAMAGDSESGSGLVVLNEGASGALRLVGNSSVEIPTKIVYVNSRSSSAVETQGNAVLDAPELRVVGKAAFTGNARCTGEVRENVAAVADPYRFTSFPSPESMPDHGSVSISSSDNTSLEPGHYSGGISISGSSSVEFKPGVYVISGPGFDFSSGQVEGHGVSLVIADGEFKVTGNAQLSLSAPTHGQLQGITITQPPSNTSKMRIAGGSETMIYGTIYAPAAKLELVGNSEVEGEGPQMGDVVVADRVELAGTATIRIGRESMPAISLPAMPLFD